MKLNELFADEDDRAVSPVVGVALLIAITVILAAVIGGVVLGLGTGGAETPQAQLNAQLDAGTDTAEIQHNGGEPLPQDEIVIRVNSTDYSLTEDFTAGGTLDLTAGTGIDGTLGGVTDGDTVTVLWEDPNSDSVTIIAEFEE